MKKFKWKFLFFTVIIVLVGTLIYNQVMIFIADSNYKSISIDELDLEKGHVEIRTNALDNEIVDVYINEKRFKNIKKPVIAYVCEGDYIYVCSHKLWDGEKELSVEIKSSENIYLEHFANGVIVRKRRG